MANLSASSGTASTPTRPPVAHVKQEPTRFPLDHFGLPRLFPQSLDELYAAASSLPSPDSVLSARGASGAGCKLEDESEDAGESSRRRPKLTAAHVAHLEAIFSRDPAGQPGKRAALARQFGVSQQQIATWFQNRRARQRTKQLQHDFELLKKCLKAAFEENQALRQELEAIRWEHSHCPPLPAAATAANAATPASLPAISDLPATLVPPPPSSPEKRPRRTLSAPSLKRARGRLAQPLTGPLAASTPEAPPLLALPVLPAMLPPLPIAVAGTSGDEAQSDTNASPASHPDAPQETTLDEAFRDLLAEDPLDGGLAELGNAGGAAHGLQLGGHGGLGASEGGVEWGCMEWEGEADSALEGLLGAHQLDPVFDLGPASAALVHEDFTKMQSAWWGP